LFVFFFSSRRRHTRFSRDWSSDVCSSDLIYDSFTITLAILLEETGFAPRGGCARRLRDGDFALDGPLPLNTHGGLLSFGHCGVAGGMGHAVEAFRQLAGRAGDRQLPGRRRAFVHADGGVMSSHVSLVFAREDS